MFNPFKWFKPKTIGKAVTTTAAVGVVAYSGFTFSERSRSNLDVCPPLVAVAEYAIKVTTVDFMIIDGLRTDEEHAENLRKGVTWVKRSLHQDGLAIDVVAIVDGEISWNPKDYPPINEAFQKAAKKLNTPITWGGEWRVRDWGHFELTNRVCFPDKTEAEI